MFDINLLVGSAVLLASSNNTCNYDELQSSKNLARLLKTTKVVCA